MAGIKHAKVLTGPDGTNANRAQPTDWNDDHDITGAVDFSTFTHKMDVLNESTADAGVTIESVLLKDGMLGASGAGVTRAYLDALNFGDEDLGTYDEGSWTPVLAAKGTALGSVSYSTQTGYYVKVGTLCLAVYTITATVTVGAGTDRLRITGCPFTAANVGYQFGTGVTSQMSSQVYANALPYVYNGTTYLEFSASQVSGTPATPSVTNLSDGSWIFRGAISYRTT